AGTGKTEAADVVSMIARGRRARSVTPSAQEFDKELVGLLLAGEQVIMIDNIPEGEPLKSAKLNSVLTSQTTAVRALGRSAITECPTNALFLLDGNNLNIYGDLCRRILVCGMDTGQENPERRTFKLNPTRVVSENRGRYIAAVLTIILAYRADGSPKQDGI